MPKESITKIIVKRPGAVLLLFFALLVISILMTGLIDFEQDIFKVLPQKNPVFKVLVHALKTSSAQNKLFLLVRSPGDSEELIRRGKNLVRDLQSIRIDNSPAFERVSFHKTGAFSTEDFQDLLSCFLRKPELFLAQDDLPRLSNLLSSDALEDQIKRSVAMLATPGAKDLSRILALDPLNLRRFLIEKLQMMHQGLKFAPGPDLLSPDGHSLLIVATPVHPPGDHVTAHLLMNEIDRIRLKTTDSEIGITGGYAIQAQERTLVRSDILGCLLGSVLGVGLLFLLIYRNPVVLCFVLMPLAVGLQLALGVMSIACNQIHMLATAFATVVLGLGIDFAVHVYDRYAMERVVGASIDTAVETSVLNTGSAVLAGCLTTLTAFLVLTLTGSPILHQIAWIVSLGLLFCLITILLALPAGLVWLERHFNSQPAHPMFRLGTDRLGLLISDRPKVFLVLSLTLVLLALPGVLKLRFEKDMAALRPQGLEALDVQEDLLNTFGAGRRYVLASWASENIESFWKKGREVDGALDKLRESGMVNEWASLGRISSENTPSLKGIDLAVVNELFRKYGLDLEHFRDTYVFLTRISRTETSARFESGANTELQSCEALIKLPDIFNPYIVCEKNVFRGIAWIMVPGEKEALKLRDVLKRTFEGLIVANPGLAVDEMVKEVRNELEMTLGVAFLMIIGILLAFFKKPLVLPLVLMPVTMGLFLTAGIMGWAGVNLNPFNFIVLPILVGIGLDDGIHIYKRYREIGEIKKTLSTTGRSVLVTTLTTVCGFGSLSMADYHVLESIGIMTIVGVVACFLFSVITLPAILKVLESGN